MSTRSRSRWFPLLWLVPAIVVALLAVVLIARFLRDQPGVQDFLAQFPGTTGLPAGTPVGFPAWLAWQHFLNSLFLLLILRSGWQIRRQTRPTATWRRGSGTKISVELWFHLAIDLLWIANGIVFFVLLFATGQWLRIVRTSWDLVPNAVSAALQYASLDWPVEDGWVNYNSLQSLTYFGVVFVLAPLAILTGARMSGFWPRGAARLNRVYRIELARVLHFPVMLLFVAFVIVHVTLVLATGALRNLNHMFAGRDDENWIGFGIFAASLVVMAGAWIGLRPVVVRSLAALTGTVGR